MRYTLPGENPGLPIPLGKIAAFAMIFSCVAGYLWQGFVHDTWGKSLLGLLFSVSGAGAVIEALRTGEFITKGTTFARAHRPIVFWLLTLLSFVLYLLFLGAMFFAGPFKLSGK